MEYTNTIHLHCGETCHLRSAGKEDGAEVFQLFLKTHGETDFLLTYPEENTFTPEGEGEFLEQKLKSENEVEILAIVDGKIVGSAGVEAIGTKYKVRHRADFGIAILKEYWGMGIGTELIQASIACAKAAGYTQLELNAVAENEKAIALYKRHGFVEYGRNPKGFNSKASGYQELVSMRLDLE